MQAKHLRRRYLHLHLVAMKRACVDPAEVGWVLLTHLHGDHFAGGLPFLCPGWPVQRAVIAGPPTVQARVEAAMEVLFPGSSTAATGPRHNGV